MAGLETNCTSGASFFAIFLTSWNPRVSVLPAPTVPVTAPSNACGTSVPGALRPSARRYDTRYRVIVTSLFVVSGVGAVEPVPLGTIRNATWPGSLKKVGHGASGVQPPPVVISVCTSDNRKEKNVPGSAPFAADSLSITRNTGARP